MVSETRNFNCWALGPSGQGTDNPMMTVLLTEGFKKLEHGCGMVYAGCPSFFGLGPEDGPIPTFWLLL